MIGDFNWGLKTKGNLTLMAKLYFAYEAIIAKRNAKNAKISNFIYNENDFIIPNSILINQTIEFLKDTHQDFLINHCFRTYLFGNIIGQNENIKFDKEIFVIASLMHDVGLVKNHQFKNPNCSCFAIEGAIETGIFLESHNLKEDKIKRIQDAISLHLNIKIPSDLPEAYLLNKGAAVDVIGRDLKNFNSEFLNKTIKYYPRLNFKEEMHHLMKHQSNERPQSRISFLYKNGFPYLLKKNNFEE
ncbi:HD domain-containing protein [Flavobacterium sp.]|uniref:HD domain-containing protein n=1 Tax=Flavobacterium sp. TaxID=239 RepID=UPI00286EB172|nr:HD domain-containing protein [Flavobacterium sp.]